jgi:hypothetical protein
VEARARKAESEAALALAAAREGEWDEAVEHAGEAWRLEFSTGGPLRHSPPTWKPLYDLVAAAAQASVR